MNSFSMYFHGGSGNRGCEAIVRSTAAMLKNTFGKSFVSLYSLAPEQDMDEGLSDVDRIVGVSYERDSLARQLSHADKIRIKLYSRVSEKKADEYYYSLFNRELPLSDGGLFLSIGGDNYCYGENSSMTAFNKTLKALGKKTVLWGCSLDNNVFTDYNVADLRTYDAVFARETGTFGLLKEHGFSNVFLFPDPAFTLETEYLPLPEGFVEKQTIGVNASPLIFRYESGERRGIGIKAYERLIEYIVGNTDYSVALIPHVYWKSCSDLKPLSELYEKFRHTGRVVFIEGEYTAPQLKGYIARCSAFVGARTHSTIAAYSSCVPTLVLGYSMKSKGIAEDLFGTSEGYVVPVDKLKDENALAAQLDALLSDIGGQTEKLQSIMPSYKKKAAEAAAKLYELKLF